MAVTGFIGRLAARGAAGFAGLVTAGLIVLALLLGTVVLIPLPDTALFVARHIDDFAAYTGYKIVDPGDHRSWQV
jgi:hypothetical protein